LRWSPSTVGGIAGYVPQTVVLGAIPEEDRAHGRTHIL
jgi:hypothetical protein